MVQFSFLLFSLFIFLLFGFLTSFPACVHFTIYPTEPQAVLWIRIRMHPDPELLFRIQQNMKEQIDKNCYFSVNSRLYCKTVV